MARKNTPTTPQDPPEGAGLGPFGSEAEQEEDGPRHFNQQYIPPPPDEAQRKFDQPAQPPPAEAPTDCASSTRADGKKSGRGLAAELGAMHKIDRVMTEMPAVYRSLVVQWFTQKYGRLASENP